MTRLYATSGRPVTLYTTSGRPAFGGGEGGATPADPARLRPATTDPDTLALRPDRQIVQTRRVGPDRDYPTITAALAGLPTVDPATQIVDIIIDPGTYRETVTTPAAGTVALFGAGPGAQVIAPDDAKAVGVLTTGGSVYVEGMEFVLPATTTGTWPKYPLHGTSSGSSAFVDVTWTARNTTIAQGRPSAVGADMGPRSTTTFLRNVFDGTTGSGLATNLHGWAANTDPLTVVFADCTTVQTQTTGYDSLGSGQADEVWIIGQKGGTDIMAKGTATRLHTDWTGPITSSSTTLRDARTDWPRVRPWAAV